ncbi:hypothetical protein E3U36_12035 (plasmid) [Arsenophonus endosymbiont of Aphis craccivora]|nr:hypothetical protein E3U36_12035 [Arsenophonus endosymbiont of Aphis craccivora]
MGKAFSVAVHSTARTANVPPLPRAKTMILEKRYRNWPHSRKPVKTSVGRAKISAFTGKPMAFRKTAIGFSNCCKSIGWGHDIGLASCDSEEKAIGKAKEKGLVVDVGEFCAEDVLGVWFA